MGLVYSFFCLFSVDKENNPKDIGSSDNITLPLMAHLSEPSTPTLIEPKLEANPTKKKVLRSGKPPNLTLPINNTDDTNLMELSPSSPLTLNTALLDQIKMGSSSNDYPIIEPNKENIPDKFTPPPSYQIDEDDHNNELSLPNTPSLTKFETHNGELAMDSNTKKKNTEFHAIFQAIPISELLISDHGCALQKGTLVQGRIYLTKNYLSFHSSIFGWTNRITIPLTEIVYIEKRHVAYVIPSAIQVNTLTQKYIFTSFRNRDLVMHELIGLWRDSRNNLAEQVMNQEPDEMDLSDLSNLPPTPNLDLELSTNDVINCDCEDHYDINFIDMIIPLPIDELFDLLYSNSSHLITNFLKSELEELELGEWIDSSRTLTYIRNSNSSKSSKPIKCTMTQSILSDSLPKFISIESILDVQNVSLNNSAKPKTRTCLIRLNANETKWLMFGSIEFTKSSFFRSVIDKPSMEENVNFAKKLLATVKDFIDTKSDDLIEPIIEQPIQISSLIDRKVPTKSKTLPKPKLIIETQQTPLRPILTQSNSTPNVPTLSNFSKAKTQAKTTLKSVKTFMIDQMPKTQPKLSFPNSNTVFVFICIVILLLAINLAQHFQIIELSTKLEQMVGSDGLVEDYMVDEMAIDKIQKNINELIQSLLELNLPSIE